MFIFKVRRTMAAVIGSSVLVLGAFSSFSTVLAQRHWIIILRRLPTNPKI